MEQQTFLPVLDYEALQKKANEAAMKGAMQAFEEFYSGYNSPYKKAIEEDLKNKSISYTFELPDIIAALNDSLSKEVDKIANEAIAKTFIPLVHRFLQRAKPEIAFSEILSQFVDCMSSSDRDDFSVDIDEDSRWKWLNIKLKCEDKEYRITFHLDSNSKEKRYKALSMPYDKSTYGRMMKLSVEGATLEMPFTSDILGDSFMSFMANIVMSGSLIIMDTEYFDDDLFSNCHC